LADGIKEYIKKLGALQKTMPDIMTELVKHETEKAIGEIKMKTPVKTGLLRNSFHQDAPMIKGGLYNGVIVNNVEYASHVEYGHRIVRGGKTVGRAEPVHMVRKGINQYRDIKMTASVKSFLTRKIKAVLK
jgi:hypothetical protein